MLLDMLLNFCLRKTLFNYCHHGSREMGNLRGVLHNIYNSLGGVDVLCKKYLMLGTV